MKLVHVSSGSQLIQQYLPPRTDTLVLWMAIFLTQKSIQRLRISPTPARNSIDLNAQISCTVFQKKKKLYSGSGVIVSVALLSEIVRILSELSATILRGI